MIEIESFLNHIALHGWSSHTVKAYRGDLTCFGKFLDLRKLRINQVTPQLIDKYIRYLLEQPCAKSGRTGLSTKSIDRRLGAISSYFEFTREMSNPKLRNPMKSRFRRRQAKRIRSNRNKAPDDTTTAALLRGITSPRDRAMFGLFLTSGLRLAECQSLDKDSIQVVSETTPDGSIRRWGAGRIIGKGNRERIFYCDANTVEALARYLATRTDDCRALFVSERKDRLSNRAIQQTLASWCTSLGLQHINVHALRHAFAQKLADASIDPVVLCELMGHSNFDTTTLYFDLKEETKARQYFAAMEFGHEPVIEDTIVDPDVNSK